MFEKTLSDVVKGVRSNRKNEHEYISRCISEIKDELRTKDPSLQAEALLKLIYLQMLGHDMSWASFHCIEVMSATKFRNRRIGYLAATVCFDTETPVALLATNLIKKDFVSGVPFDASMALNCLANIANPDLSRDLVTDLVSLTQSSKPFLRKRALLSLYKVFLQYPEALRPSFPHIQAKLEDGDIGVASCAVNVICELAKLNPQNYLGLAPLFFKLLTHTSNNWMMIKLVKLLGTLCPFEPRLAKKLIAPIAQIMRSTSAKSLLYECIHTVSVGMTTHEEIVDLAMEKLQQFVSDSDQNLKYLGLVAMGNFIHDCPEKVAPYRDVVLKCLKDEDVTIRRRALQLVGGLTDEDNLIDIVDSLLDHSGSEQSSDIQEDIYGTVIKMCTADDYIAITDFEWFLDTIFAMVRKSECPDNSSHAIARIIEDIASRVEDVREECVAKCYALMRDSSYVRQADSNDGVCAVVRSCMWAAGQYCKSLVDVSLKQLVEQLAQTCSTTQSLLLQQTALLAATKTMAALCASGTEADGEMSFLCEAVIASVVDATKSSSPEVQERACFLQQLVEFIKQRADTAVAAASKLSHSFSFEPSAMGAKAQRRVSVPEGFTEQVFVDLDEEAAEDAKEAELAEMSNNTRAVFEQPASKKQVKKSKKELKRLKKQRESDPFYLRGKAAGGGVESGGDVEDIPMYELRLSDDEGNSNSQDVADMETDLLGEPLSEESKADLLQSKQTPSSEISEQTVRPKKKKVRASVRKVQRDGDDIDRSVQSTGSGKKQLSEMLNVEDVTKPLEDGETLPEQQQYERASVKFDRTPSGGFGASQSAMSASSSAFGRSSGKGKEKKGKDKKSKDKKEKLSVQIEGGVDGLSAQVKALFKSDESVIQLKMQLSNSSSTTLNLQSVECANDSLASSVSAEKGVPSELAAGGKSVLTLAVKPSPSSTGPQIGLQLVFAQGTALVTVNVPFNELLVPCEAEVEDVMQQISAMENKQVQSTTLTCDSLKKAIKKVKKVVNAAEVQAKPDSAMLACEAAGGGIVVMLLKMSKDGGQATVGVRSKVPFWSSLVAEAL